MVGELSRQATAMSPTKACPVLTRLRSGQLEVLAFKHPRGGCQLVKGGIEPNETPSTAALRELAEEAGIPNGRVVRDLGVWETGFEEQVWALYLVDPGQALPDAWNHETSDGGGHTFAFFWQDLSLPPTIDWHPLFASALGKIKEVLALDQRTMT